MNGKLARVAAACLCMLAVTLLYAPLAAAALLGHGMGCCTLAYCPIREHHHHKQAPTQEQKPMDCGHDMGGMKACSMSCCQDQGQLVVMPGVFVLPTLTFVPAAGEMIRAVQVSGSQEISRFAKPLSPPPRFPAQVL